MVKVTGNYVQAEPMLTSVTLELSPDEARELVAVLNATNDYTIRELRLRHKGVYEIIEALQSELA